MKENNPVRNPETRAKIAKRMADPDVRALFLGDNNPAKRPEVREKIKAKWTEPEFREKQRQRMLGVPIHSEENKERQRQKLLDPSHPMRVQEYHKTLNSDPEIKAKRTASLQTPEVRAKISEGLKRKWAERKAMAP